MARPPSDGEAPKRRTAEEARRLILDAAEAQLAKVGPAGIRLQEVAAAVGISHPAVLHHFKSREGLVDAVLARAIDSLNQELVAAFARSVDAARATELLEHVFRVLGDKGHARTLAWLLLADDRAEVVPGHVLERVASAVHALREHARGERVPPREDTQFAILLAALALFGDALAGETMRQSAGLDADAGPRFREWLAKLLVAHLERGV